MNPVARSESMKLQVHSLASPRTSIVSTLQTVKLLSHEYDSNSIKLFLFGRRRRPSSFGQNYPQKNYNTNNTFQITSFPTCKPHSLHDPVSISRNKCFKNPTKAIPFVFCCNCKDNRFLSGAMHRNKKLTQPAACRPVWLHFP